jgi:hypothetical protein|nr:MAG TPA: Rad52/22 family double-strand break repair protein [Caudoviricetes sp.]
MAQELEQEIEKLQLDISQVTRTASLLNQNQIQKIWNSTPARYKYQRPAKGGGSWTYIKGSYVRKVLDSVFGFNWSFDVDTTLAEAFEVAKLTGAVVVKGTLIGRVKNDGEWVELRKTQFGRADVKWEMTAATTETGTVIYETDKNGRRKPKRVRKIDEYTKSPIPLDLGNDFKAAATDALKKCASLMGIGADVYEADEFMEIQIIGSDEERDSAKATTKKLKEMKDIKVTEVEE